MSDTHNLFKVWTLSIFAVTMQDINLALSNIALLGSIIYTIVKFYFELENRKKNKKEKK